jgi:hypothetical protein
LPRRVSKTGSDGFADASTRDANDFDQLRRGRRIGLLLLMRIGWL